MCFQKSILKLKTIKSWQDNNVKKNELGRKNVKICIIDNDGVNLTQLKEQNYELVTWETDYTKLDDVKDYDVVLCDIKDVGLKFKNKKQGLCVAEEIKKNFPNKIVLIYSGQNPKDFDSSFDRENNMFDGFVVKGEGTLDLVNELDKYCKVFWDPVAGWERIEKILRKQDTSNKVIAYMEHEFVKALQTKNCLDVDSLKSADAFNRIKDIVDFASTVISIYLAISKI